MRLPRRVPWASIAELEQVCFWIYQDEFDLDSKVLALNRISGWRAITSLPHALESTLSLLAVIIQDSVQKTASTNFLYLRQSYATAIIRLVNGLVDPLQLGAYARSIASIAAQLGLPAWLVELRHASTHEDLPSLELLREGAKESMSWLLRNYFLPTTNPSSAVQAHGSPLRPLAPLLKQYKNILKVTTRDASVKSQFKDDINSLIRNVERWVSEARVAANISLEGDSLNPEIDIDAKERWALEKLCDALLEKGILVPVSKKKRTFPADTFYPPLFSVALWNPLLDHLRTHHPDLPAVLSRRIVSYLLSDILVAVKPLAPGQTIPDIFHHDMSFDMCLARWAMWIIDNNDIDDSSDSEFDLKKEAIISLITAFGPTGNDSTRDRKAALALLQNLSAGSPTPLTTLLPLTTSTPAEIKWHSDDGVTMEHRLQALLALDMETSPSSGDTSVDPASYSKTNLPSGWKLLDEEWRPCPIGFSHVL